MPRGALLTILVLATGSLPAQANAAFAPIARAVATPEQAVVGEAVQFDGSASVDPDAGPSSLTFLWDFGDGAMASNAAPVHAFVQARAYVVTLSVSDGVDSASATLVVHVLPAPSPLASVHSSPMVLTRDGAQLWVANPDSGTVTLVDVSATAFKAAEIPACTTPRTLALRDRDATLLVACQGDDTVAVIDVAARTVTARLPTGHGPYAVAVAPNDDRVIVTNQYDGTLTIYSATLVEEARVVVGDSPRAIAIDGAGARAFVTQFISRGVTGEVSVVDLSTATATGDIALLDDSGPDTTSSGRGVPNLLSAAVIDPAGLSLWVGGLKSNTSAGLFRNGVAISSENWVRGVAAPIDITLATERLARRIDTNDADSVSAMAFSGDGRYGYFAHQGAGMLSIYDMSLATLYDPGAGTTVPFASRIDVGDAPQAVVLAPDGDRLFVANFMSRNLSVVDVRDPKAPLVIITVAVTSETLPPAIALGKLHFYRSREPVYSHSNYIACASCHPDGGSDGRVWDFTQKGEGLRKTKDLRGVAGMGDGAVHWSANFDEIQDFELDIVDIFGGTGLANDGRPPNAALGPGNAGRSADLDALAAYVTSLAAPPPSPHRAPGGSLTAAARRGQELFFSSTLRCSECHAPPRYTTSTLDGTFALVDVGTLTPASGKRLGEPLVGLDVPSLAGAWASAPYFHDGSASTLREVFRGRPQILEAELTVQLSGAQLDDLEAFVLSLDGHDDAPRPLAPDGGCACSGVGDILWPVTVLALWRARRSRTGVR